jgi:hypothetical protein
MWKNQGRTDLRNLRQSVVSIDEKTHNLLHQVFDQMYPKYARQVGKEGISSALARGETTPQKLFNAMIKVAKKVLKNDKSELEKALKELKRLREKCLKGKF